MLLDGLHGNNFVCCIDFNRRNPVPDVSLYCKTFRHLCVGCTVLRCFERIADRQFITMLGVNPAVTLILLSGSVTLALFVDSPWYIWAASMQTRYYELHLVWISCLIWLLASLLLIPIGTVIFARKDIYLKGERTNAR